MTRQTADALLDQVENHLEKLASDHQLLISSTKRSHRKVKRWRWDEPTFVMEWTEEGTEVRKSLNVKIQENGKLTIEKYAWKDKDDETGRRTRFWRPSKVAGDFEVAEIGHVLSDAFNDLASWPESSLKDARAQLREAEGT